VPDSVRSLGSRCGARITTHEPLFVGGFANKLRGFEVDRQTDHMLLMECDMLVLSDIHGLLSDLGCDCIAGSASIGRCRVPNDRWSRVHEALGIPFPEDQVIPINLALDTFQCAIYRDSDYFPPYYHGGMLFAPWSSGLGEMWHDHLHRIFAIDPDIKGPGGLPSNQPSLATAITEMQRQGWEFRFIPDAYHVHWQHMAAGTVCWNEAKMHHTVGFGRWPTRPGKEHRGDEQVDTYLANIIGLTKRLRSHRNPFTRIAHYFTRHPQIQDCHRAHALMKSLYEKHVRDLTQ
jgi:hypothetical protein